MSTDSSSLLLYPSCFLVSVSASMFHQHFSYSLKKFPLCDHMSVIHHFIRPPAFFSGSLTDVGDDGDH